MQRHLEILLYQRFDGGSSGAIWKALNNSGLQSTSLNASRKAVDDGFLLEVELAQIMSVFKLNLPAECCDPSQLGPSAPPPFSLSPRQLRSAGSTAAPLPPWLGCAPLLR